MKKPILLNYVFLLLFTVNFAQTKIEREKRVEMADVPAPAVLFISKIPVKKVKWYQEESQEGTSFEAKFCYQKFYFSVEFTKEGTLIDVEKKVKFKSLGSDSQFAISQHFTTNYQKTTIKKVQIQYKGLEDEVFKVFENKDRSELKTRVFYEIVVKAKKDGETALYEILFDELGKHLKTLKFAPDNHLNLEF